MGISVGRIFALAILGSVAGVLPAQALDAKQITLKVGYGAGGTFDVSSRLIARHLGRFLPNHPEIVVQNVPGGGSLKLAKLMMGSEPADGSVIGSISQSTAFARVWGADGVDFDPAAIVWLGSLSAEPAYCATTKASGIDTMEKFLSGEFHIGASAKNSQTYQLAALVKNGLNAHFNIVTGFAGVAEIELAMERGEIAGHCSASITDLARRSMLDGVNIIGRLGSSVPPEAANIQRFSALIEDPVVRQGAEFIEASRDIGYPLMVPPNTPKDTVKVLRDAYSAMTSDPEFVSAAKALGEFTLSPTTGERMNEIVQAQLGAGDAVLAAARRLVE